MTGFLTLKPGTQIWHIFLHKMWQPGWLSSGHSFLLSSGCLFLLSSLSFQLCSSIDIWLHISFHFVGNLDCTIIFTGLSTTERFSNQWIMGSLCMIMDDSISDAPEMLQSYCSLLTVLFHHLSCIVKKSYIYFLRWFALDIAFALFLLS